MHRDFNKRVNYSKVLAILVSSGVLVACGKNDAPAPAASSTSVVAVADSSGTTRDTAVTISVLGNDANVNAETVTLSVISIAGYGSVVINADNTFTYTPNASYLGDDSFTYALTDSAGHTSRAVVSVHVACGAPCMHTIEVDWTASSDPDITGYYVYHGVTADMYSERIWVPTAQTAYQLDTAAVGDHYFAITAVNSSNMESVLSDATTINVPVTL